MMTWVFDWYYNVNVVHEDISWVLIIKMTLAKFMHAAILIIMLYCSDVCSWGSINPEKSYTLTSIRLSQMQHVHVGSQWIIYPPKYSLIQRVGLFLSFLTGLVTFLFTSIMYPVDTFCPKQLSIQRHISIKPMALALLPMLCKECIFK